MPLEKTYEELLASKINPRNPSAVLPVIYNLRKKSFEPYVPPAVARIGFSNSVVGDAGATAVFNAINFALCQCGLISTFIPSIRHKLNVEILFKCTWSLTPLPLRHTKDKVVNFM